MSSAVNLFLQQIVLRGGIPFELTLPAVPMCGGVPDMSRMTKEQEEAGTVTISRIIYSRRDIPAQLEQGE